LLAHREFPSSPSFRKPCRADNAIYLIGLQWTKARHGATLHCNVDRFGAGSLTVEIHRKTPHPFPHQKSKIPWIFICAASAF
jgi:hypothetical protein